MEPSKTEEKKPAGESKSNEAPKCAIKPFTKKNWDAIIDEYEKEEQEQLGINELFKQIYESSDDEVRRAMNKSYEESGGTVLSTNWKNVADKKVEPKPPSEHDGKTQYDL